MKGKRYKRTQHLLKTVYRHGFGLREPYQILCDASFIRACLQNKIDAREALPALLDGKIKLMTTACVMEACRAMDRAEQVGAGIAAKRMETRRCVHSEGKVSPTECIKAIIQPDNPHHYLVATCEEELKTIVRPIASCPLLLIHKAVLVMEEPTAEVKATVHRGQQGRLAPKKADLDRLKKLFKLESDTKPAPLHRRKRKAKAPNPLSQRKPSKAPKTKAAQPKKKRVRNRHKPKSTSVHV